MEQSPLEDAQFRAGLAAFKVWQAMPHPKLSYTGWYYEVKTQSLRDALEGEKVNHNNERGK